MYALKHSNRSSASNTGPQGQEIDQEQEIEVKQDLLAEIFYNVQLLRKATTKRSIRYMVNVLCHRQLKQSALVDQLTFNESDVFFMSKD